MIDEHSGYKLGKLETQDKMSEEATYKGKNLHQRIVDVMLAVQAVIKDSEVQVTKERSYLAVSHDAVTKALHLPLAKAGIVVKSTQDFCEVSDFEQIKVWNGQETRSKIYRADIQASLTLINADNPRDRETYILKSYAFDSGDKAIGKAFSMAIKNILLKAFMLESLDHEEDRPTEPIMTPKVEPKPTPMPSAGAPVTKPPVKNYA